MGGQRRLGLVEVPDVVFCRIFGTTRVSSPSDIRGTMSNNPKRDGQASQSRSNCQTPRRVPRHSTSASIAPSAAGTNRMSSDPLSPSGQASRPVIRAAPGSTRKDKGTVSPTKTSGARSQTTERAPRPDITTSAKAATPSTIHGKKAPVPLSPPTRMMTTDRTRAAAAAHNSFRDGRISVGPRSG